MNDETIHDISVKITQMAGERAMKLYQEAVEAVPVEDYWRQQNKAAHKRADELAAKLSESMELARELAHLATGELAFEEKQRADNLQKRIQACRDIVTTAMPDIESPLDHTVIQLVERLADSSRGDRAVIKTLRESVEACRAIVAQVMPDLGVLIEDETAPMLVGRLGDYCRALYAEMERRTAEYAAMQQKNTDLHMFVEGIHQASKGLVDPGCYPGSRTNYRPNPASTDEAGRLGDVIEYLEKNAANYVPEEIPDLAKRLGVGWLAVLEPINRGRIAKGLVPIVVTADAKACCYGDPGDVKAPFIKCSVEGCDNPRKGTGWARCEEHKARKYAKLHYQAEGVKTYVEEYEQEPAPVDPGLGTGIKTPGGMKQ